MRRKYWGLFGLVADRDLRAVVGSLGGAGEDRCLAGQPPAHPSTPVAVRFLAVRCNRDPRIAS
jgi:hypothetical protein